MNENTDLPAFDTCASALPSISMPAITPAIFLPIATLPHAKIARKGTTFFWNVQDLARFFQFYPPLLSPPPFLLPSVTTIPNNLKNHAFC